MRRDEVIAALQDKVEVLRRRFAVRGLRLFGSLARDEAGESSDIDLLVDFGGAPGFDQYMDLKFYLEDLLGSRVDLVTETGLRSRVRSYVEREAIRVA